MPIGVVWITPLVFQEKGPLGPGFIVGDNFTDSKGRRIIKEITALPEISFVTFPANDKANVLNVKSIKENVREFEKHLKNDLGFSNSESKRIASLAFRSNPRDVDNEIEEKQDENLCDVDELSVKLLFANIEMIMGGAKNDN